MCNEKYAVIAQRSYPLISQLRFHLFWVISVTGLVIWNTREPAVQIVIIIAVVFVRHLGSLQALSPAQTNQNISSEIVFTYEMTFCASGTLMVTSQRALVR